jgi:hypothetical protein
MMIDPPSDAVLRDTFERVLTGILDGSMLAAPECNGLDEQTRAALRMTCSCPARCATS